MLIGQPLLDASTAAPPAPTRRAMPSMLHQRITAHKNAHRDRKLQRALAQRDSATTSILKSLAIVVGVCTLVYVIHHAQDINLNGLPHERESEHDMFGEEL